MSSTKGITTLQLQGSPDAKSEVVIHDAPNNISSDLTLFTEDFAALNIKENSPSSSIKASSVKHYNVQEKVHHVSTNTDEFAHDLIYPDSSVQQQSYIIRQSILNQLLLILPSMIDERLEEYSNLESPLPTDTLKTDIGNIRKKQNDLQNELRGYKTKTDVMVDRIKAIENSLKSMHEEIEQHFSQEIEHETEDNVTEKRKEFESTENRLKDELEELRELKSKLKSHLDQNRVNTNIVKEIDSSQNFVSSQYDAFLREQMAMKGEVKEIKQKLAKQENKTEHIFNYSTWDHVEFSGIPYCFGPNGIENCKEMIVNICRELHYNIPINEISTAHRLRHHPDKIGPPKIIVRFKDRDIRNDVLKLRSLVKNKFYWKNYGIQKLFINEQLTPDKKKLMYQTKIFTREMFRIHGKIFAWSFKGEIYIRKASEYAPKRKINCEQDLNDLRRGTVSLDPTAYKRTSYATLRTDVIPRSIPPVFSLQEYPSM